MTRPRVDLKQILPVWGQYVLAICVAAAVMFLAWRIGRNEPHHSLLTPWFLAIWKWVLLTVIVVAIAVRLLARSARRKRAQSDAPRPGSQSRM